LHEDGEDRDASEGVQLGKDAASARRGSREQAKERLGSAKIDG
jgi:hypothetical protein